MIEDKPEKKPPPERLGPCGVFNGCKEGCDAYAHDVWVDGFRICTCGHTQNIHALVG